jgi:hypothetical protein
MAAERASKAAHNAYKQKMSQLATTLPRSILDLEREHAECLSFAVMQIREIALGVDDLEIEQLEKSLRNHAAQCAPALLAQEVEGGHYFFADRLEGA